MKYPKWYVWFSILLLFTSSTIIIILLIFNKNAFSSVPIAATAIASAAALIYFVVILCLYKSLRVQIQKAEEYHLQTARFINYYEHASDAMFLFDEETIIECNNRSLEMFGCEREDIVGHSPAYISPEYQPNGKTSREMVNIIYNRTIESGQPQLFEWMHKRMDGTLVETEVSYSLIDIAGKMIPQAIVRDITQRKKNEAELERHREHLEELVKERTEELETEVRTRLKAEEEMRQVFKIAGDGLLLFNTDQKVTAVNDLMLQLTGKPSEEFTSPARHNCSDCGHDPMNCPVEKMIENPAKIEYDGELVRAGGRIPCMITLVPYYNSSGELHGVVQSVKDISDRVKAETAATIEAEQRGRITMTSDMLHDIGNALAGINLFTMTPQSLEEWQEISLLRQLNDYISGEAEKLKQVIGEKKEDALENFMEVVISALENRKKEDIASAEKLTRTVKHISAILDLHRYYAKSDGARQHGVVDMRQLVSDSLIILSCNLEKRRIKVETSVSGEYFLIDGDRTRLMRMLLNVIKNSYEAFSSITDGRERTLEVSLKELKDCGQMEIIFLDNASGFSPETVTKLFNRDFTTKDTGSGIGLPECQAVVESHRGTINIHSDGEGCGASVTIHLPLYRKKSTGE